MKYSGAEIIVKLLERQGIQVIAGIPGGANLPLYTALKRSSSIRHILTRHEQGAGFIAQGMARSTGRAAVCFATSGPGATNLITAIADAKLDSIPIIAITGQVSSNMIGSDAFQEVDMYGLTVPITKHNYLAKSAADLLQIIPESFRIAESPRSGPVAIDVPKDVQQQEVEVASWPTAENRDSVEPDIGGIEQVAELINKSKRPLLYVGGGIIQSGAQDFLYELAKKASIPVTLTLMGLGCFPPDDPLYLGMLGMHGSRSTNYIVSEADLLLAFGVRFDDRATGNAAKFCPEATIVHVDIDPSEINKIKQAHASLSGDIGTVLEQLIPLVNADARLDWLGRINRIRADHPFPMPDENDLYHPINIIKSVSRLADPDTIVATDVGQHQMWVAQAYPFQRPRTLLSSGGLGTMGFGMPAAMGAAFANPGKRIICFSGDGSLLMNIQELATLADWQLDVTIILFKNGHLGLVRQQQELFYEQNYIASRFMTNPDFVAIARGFGIRGYDLAKDGSDPASIFKMALAEPGPCLISVPIDEAENVYPMVPPGKANIEMIGGETGE